MSGVHELQREKLLKAVVWNVYCSFQKTLRYKPTACSVSDYDTRHNLNVESFQKFILFERFDSVF